VAYPPPMPSFIKLAGAFTDVVCDGLVGEFTPSLRLGDRSGCPAPDELMPALHDLAVDLAQNFATNVNRINASIIRYDEGAAFGPHRDLEPHWSFSKGRTVSYSVLLSDDFDGGEVIVDGQDVGLRRGDFVGFTATTWHEVRPVTAGQRFVLVVFGRYL
jgi:predicted 2-oxoglutarate/Fe(II)-dependent dioxygenase YbiX